MVNTLPQMAARFCPSSCSSSGLALLLVDTISPDARSNTSMAVVGALGSLAARAAASVWLSSPAPGCGHRRRDHSVRRGDQSGHDGAVLHRHLRVRDGAGRRRSPRLLPRPHEPSGVLSLVVFAATGMALLAAANSLAVVFVALEMVSLPSYVLVAYLKQRPRGASRRG